MNKQIYSLLLFTVLSFGVKSQSINHIQIVFKQYQKSLDSLTNLMNPSTKNVDSIPFESIINYIEKMQQQKFSLDSAFVEFKYLSNKAHLKTILRKKNLKKKNRKQLEYDLLEWSISTCHPQSELLWHRVSKFFYSLEMASLNNQQKDKQSTQLFLSWIQRDLPLIIKEQQEIASLILRDLKE